MNIREEIIFDSVSNISQNINLDDYSTVVLVSGDNEYEIDATKQALDSFSSKTKQNANNNMQCKSISIPSSEACKTQSIVDFLYSIFAKFQVDRSSLIIAVGGGAISDCVGFAASTYMRGVEFAIIPTTLLSCVDASIGIKRAINTDFAKNIIGSFWPSKFIYIDTSLFYTLPDIQYQSGICEVIKMGFATDTDILKELDKCQITDNYRIADKSLQGIISKTIKAKQDVVEKDPYDKLDLRAALNYGHTFGHAIEAACNYALPHGFCVAYGMDIVAEGEIKELQNNYFKRFSIDLDEIEDLVNDIVPNKQKIIDLAMLDKKNIKNNVRLITVKKLGEIEISSCSRADIEKLLIK